jgi:hypothetical protein
MAMLDSKGLLRVGLLVAAAAALAVAVVRAESI